MWKASAFHCISSTTCQARRLVSLRTFDLPPDTEINGEWRLVADVSVEEGDVEDLMGGFSISGMEELRKSSTATALIYLPFPHYNDEQLVAELCSDADLTVGKWIKKAAEPIAWAVLGSVIAIVVTPIWDDIYKRKIAPRLDEVIKNYRELLNAKGVKIELVQIVLFKDAEVEVRIVPSRQRAIKPHAYKPKSLRRDCRRSLRFCKRTSKKTA